MTSQAPLSGSQPDWPGSWAPGEQTTWCARQSNRGWGWGRQSDPCPHRGSECSRVAEAEWAGAHTREGMCKRRPSPHSALPGARPRLCPHSQWTGGAGAPGSSAVRWSDSWRHEAAPGSALLEVGWPHPALPSPRASVPTPPALTPGHQVHSTPPSHFTFPGPPPLPTTSPGPRCDSARGGASGTEQTVAGTRRRENRCELQAGTSAEEEGSRDGHTRGRGAKCRPRGLRWDCGVYAVSHKPKHCRLAHSSLESGPG